MACMPFIVGRENIMQARAISMVTVRLATVISPAVGGIIIAMADVGWTYLIAAAGTGLTLLPLLRLPSMQPRVDQIEHPLRALADGFRFLFSNTVVASAALIGTLVTLTTAIRALFPAMAENAFGGGAMEVGLMYSAVPLGATLGAVVSGWTSALKRPGLVMMLVSLGAFLCMMLLGLNRHFVPALLLLGGVWLSGCRSRRCCSTRWCRGTRRITTWGASTACGTAQDGGEIRWARWASACWARCCLRWAASLCSAPPR